MGKQNRVRNAMRDMKASSQRIRQGMDGGRVHRPKAQTAVEASQGNRCTGLKVTTVANGLEEIRRNQPDALKRVEIDHRMGKLVRECLDTMSEGVKAGSGGDIRGN